MNARALKSVRLGVCVGVSWGLLQDNKPWSLRYSLKQTERAVITRAFRGLRPEVNYVPGQHLKIPGLMQVTKYDINTQSVTVPCVGGSLSATFSPDVVELDDLHLELGPNYGPLIFAPVAEALFEDMGVEAIRALALKAARNGHVILHTLEITRSGRTIDCASTLGDECACA